LAPCLISIFPQETAAALTELHPLFEQLVQNYRNVKTKDDKMKFKEQYQYTSPSNFLQQNLDKLGECGVMCL